MKKLHSLSVVMSICLISHISNPTSVFAQNLVPNPGFETFSSCPTNISQLSLATPWVSPTAGTPDLFNACTLSSCSSGVGGVPDNVLGTQTVAGSGSGYAGFFTYSSLGPVREYVQVALPSLTVGVSYNVTFYVSLAEVDLCQGANIVATNNIGAYLSTTAPTSGTVAPLAFTPQINSSAVITTTTGWAPVSGTFTPSVTGVHYITIGNFFDDASTTQTVLTSGGFWNVGYYYIDDVCVTPVGGSGCVVAGGVNVTIIPADASCNGKCDGTAQANPSGGIAPYTYSWNTTPVQTTQTATGLCSGNYTVTVTDAATPTAAATTAIVTITQPPPIPVTITATPVTIVPGNSAQLTATGGGTYQWSPSTGLSCDTCATTIASPTVTTTYSVTVTDASGCTAKANITINVELPCGELFVPNAFSPNNDGANEQECLFLNPNCITDLHFAIYDRWGEKVFETTDPNDVCWDGKYKGKLLNTAVFVFYLNVAFTNAEKTEKKGNISLIR